jgi:protocatechuate 3,4-dioxygenase beta subunit
MKRRDFIKRGMVGGALGLVTGTSFAARPTPAEIEGPFYPVYAQKDTDFDLTHIQGQAGVARGKIIIIRGRVLDTEGKPIEDATVDLWQANAAGRYRHPHDPNKAPLDPNFQGWAIVPSGRDGGFRFKTVYPGAYPASDTWMRPPHIHFKISKRGYVELVTQMYFPGESLNAVDLLLRRKSAEEHGMMIATRLPGEAEIYEYDVVLARAGE